jgi:hypothetical protein
MSIPHIAKWEKYLRPIPGFFSMGKLGIYANT